MLFRQIFDERLAQYAYLIGCQRTRQAIVVDPERDAERFLEIAAHENLNLVAATETHIHADFLSGVRELATRVDGLEIYLSDEGDDDWKYRWPDEDGIAWTPIRGGDVVRVGNVELRVVATPGHTPEHVAFEIVDRGGGVEEPMAWLSGDFVFVGDLGRPDLLETAAGVVGAREPSARRLFASANRFLELPDHLQVWPGHGAGSACGKALGAVPTSTVGYERRFSPALAAVREGEAPFVEFILEGQPEPPPYFARMKSLNKLGPPVLGSMPAPEAIGAAELVVHAASLGTVVIDARRDRPAFFERHLAGSLFLPFDRSFATLVGSYVDAESAIVLVVAPEFVTEAVACCVRVGVDRVIAWAPPEAIAALPDDAAASIERLDWRTALALADESDAAWLDVRAEEEFAVGHVDGAIRIAHTRVGAEIERIPTGRPLLVYCGVGGRSAPVVSLLARRGFDVRQVDDDVANLPRDRRATGA